MEEKPKRGSVLCVDDEPGILRSLQWLLQKEFDVQTATSGQQGLMLVAQNNFDVVISDQRMPGMMGSEFLSQVRKTSPRALRILLTGYSDLQAMLRSVNEGEVFRFINKPWNISELPRIVGEAALIAQTQPAPPTLIADAPEEILFENASDVILFVDDDPAAAQLLQAAMANSRRVVHARNLADAVAALNTENISVILSDTLVANADTTQLLKLLKQQRPQIVTVVISAESDASGIIKLINEGQIYRFVPKPINAEFLKVVIASALAKHKQIAENPDFIKRHSVERIETDAESSLMLDLAKTPQPAVAASVQPAVAKVAGTSEGTSFLQKISSSFRSLFKKS